MSNLSESKLGTEQSSQPNETETRELTLASIRERIGLDADSKDLPFPCIFFWDWPHVSISSEDEPTNSSDVAAGVIKGEKMSISTADHPRLGPILESETLILGATLRSSQTVDTSASGVAERSIELILHISAHPNLMSSPVLSMFAHQVKFLLEAVLRNPEAECSLGFVCRALSVSPRSQKAGREGADGKFF